MRYKPNPAGPKSVRELFHYLWKELTAVGKAIEDGGGTPGPVDHGDLTGVTPNQHHAQSHAHNGADGSGTVSYNDLTDTPPSGGVSEHDELLNVTPNQHHNQVHAWDGTDHTGMPATFPPDAHTHTHASTTGQTENDHHDKQHAHDGVDGSGQIDYGDLLNLPPPQGTGQAKNLLINGGFDIWQRGTSFSPTGAITYNSDRWVSLSDTQVDRVIDAPSDTEHKYAIQFSRTSGVGTLLQGVETGNSDAPGLIYSGRVLTFSAWIKAPVGVPVDLRTQWRSGVRNTAGTLTDLPLTTIHTGTGLWERVAFTWTTNFIYDGTLPIYTMRLQLPATEVMRATRLQLELGDTANDFEYRHISEELALCQRYFATRLPAAGAGYAAGAGQSARAITNVSYPVTMRTLPAVTFTRENESNSDGVGVFSVPTESGTGVGQNSLASGSQWWRGWITADAEL